IEIKGFVKDKSGSPISYATVMVLQLPDSAFITGGITDDKGYFLIKDKEYNSNKILQISCVRYLSYSSVIKTPYEGIIIILEESTEIIDEIMISAQKRIIKPSKGGFIANIENSVLSELGNVKDVLSQLPFVLEMNDQISILGKGEALIYIDNRKVNNESELGSLKSYEIKNIEVIMSPGVEYEASANAVIKITTLKKRENGIGGNITSEISFKERLSEFGDLALKYNKDQIELFTEFQINDNRKDYKRIYEYDIYTNDVKFFETRNEGKVKENMLKTYFVLGMNWDIDEKNSLGIKYTYDKKPHNDIYQTSQINTSFLDDSNKETFFQIIRILIMQFIII
ncbi:MAG: carboxypeptidase-like regulatory domain-containing protein, partial [Tannerellaceae bacterium]|nr:carboxypeptidase-like regulatory domain-containing protein [Tannerellaceae bacterium]